MNTASPRTATSTTLRLIAAALTVALCAALLPATPADAEPSPDHQLAVRVGPEVDVRQLAHRHGALEAEPLVASHDLWVLSFTDADAEQDALDELADTDGVRWTV